MASMLQKLRPRKFNQKGFGHHLVLPVLVMAMVAAVGGYVLIRGHAATLSYRNYLTVNHMHVKAVLGRDYPNTQLMNQDQSGYTQGLLYGPGFTISNQTAGGYEVYNNQPVQGVGFYEGSGGMTDNQTVKIHAYINPNKTNGVYTGSITLKYYEKSSQQWLNGPIIDYTITLVDSYYANYITLKHVNDVSTLQRSKAVSGFVYGKGVQLTGVQTGGFEIVNNQPTQGVGFHISSGGIQAGQTLDIGTYINTNLPDGVYTGSATLKYLNSQGVYADGPTLTYAIYFNETPQKTPLDLLTTIVTGLNNGGQADVTASPVTVPGPVTDAQARPIVFTYQNKTYFAYTQLAPPDFTLSPSDTANTMAIVVATVDNPPLTKAHLDKSSNLVDQDSQLVGYSSQ